MASVSDFLTRYSAFSTVPVHVIELAIASSTHFCPFSVWGTKQQDGIFLRVAHTLTMEWMQTGQTAAAASATASGSGFSSPSGAEDDLDLTTYGRQFKALKNTIPAIGIIL